MKKLQVLDFMIYHIDYDNGILISKNPSYDMKQFIFQLAEDTKESMKSQLFCIKNENTQVVSVVLNSVGAIIRGDENNNDIFKSGTESIASRLLDKETVIQERMEKLDINVKKGSLLQALLFSPEEGTYFYLITKIEHKDFFEDINYNKLTGFSADKNKFFKSCLFSLEMNDENSLFITQIEVFLDNKAVYWTTDFLEIESVRRDDKNTFSMFKNIEKVLQNEIYKKSRYDYQMYRNHVLGYIKNQTRIHYDDMLENVFKNSHPEFLSRDIVEKLIAKLEKLPEEKKFDREFNCVHSAINARKQNRSFDLNQGVQLVVTGYIPEEMGCIDVESTEEGEYYVRVKTNNQEALETFSKRK